VAKKFHWVAGSLVLGFLIFGFIFSIQYNTQQNELVSLESQQTADLITMVKSLTERRSGLEDELAKLTSTYASLDSHLTLERQIKQLEIFAGTKPLIGQGITITITEESPLVHYDLIDIVNELWVSGAEAISINDIRIHTTTSITTSATPNNQTVITVDKKPLKRPVIIKAIGNADTLEKGLTFTGGIIDNLTTLYNVYPIITKSAEVHVPAAEINYNPLYEKQAK